MSEQIVNSEIKEENRGEKLNEPLLRSAGENRLKEVLKRYANLMDKIKIDDLEAGTESIHLHDFFEDVENVQDDMRAVQKLYNSLREAYEKTKTATNTKASRDLRTRIDADVNLVLNLAKDIKAKLEGLDRSNVAHRNIPGCGPGSSADRTRTSVVSGLGEKLKDLMDDFQGLRWKISSEYKETVERIFFTVTGEKADEELIEKLISSGESESLLQKAIQAQGRVEMMETVKEMQERHDAIKEIEKNMMEIHQLFLDMAAIVVGQGQELNDIESNVKKASSFVRHGANEMGVAKDHQKNTRKWAIVLAIILAILLILLILFLILYFTLRAPHSG